MHIPLSTLAILYFAYIFRDEIRGFLTSKMREAYPEEYAKWDEEQAKINLEEALRTVEKYKST